MKTRSFKITLPNQAILSFMTNNIFSYLISFVSINFHFDIYNYNSPINSLFKISTVTFQRFITFTAHRSPGICPYSGHVPFPV